MSDSRHRVSIVIPTLNEAAVIAGAVEAARRLGACEVVVADGGSDDGTSDLARQADRVLVCQRGRAVQQNAGAAAAAGDVLAFLHADCRLQPGALEAIERVLADSRVVAGCFRQRIDAAGVRYRLLERGNALRVRALQWAYGDQGIFVRREAFERAGGFPELPLMEDLWLMKRLKRVGRIVLVDQRIVVSARRWQRTGVVRQTLRNWSLVLLAHLGVSPARLARLYPHVR
ncbi:MAG: TIGR04283 family arsenosugar biosynthesis glycosyltransferase, partial [Planctomycetes bacterium]|nr:TIGR04283 family arsenosugar biosynthesis glycosyltransferase [Planctomycetota bacterium]